MNKEKLEARLAQLQQEKIAAMGAYDGAIQDTNYWLQELTKEQNGKADSQQPVEPAE